MPDQPRQPMRDILQKLLKQEWLNISGGGQYGELFWCEIDRRDIRSTYERIIQVIAALSGVGGQGKEMWVNLTGGTNVTNFALQLAATLSGDVARMYYVQAENQAAEKCIRFTSENNYWIEMPVLPLILSETNIAVLKLIE
jgi:CRISPR/Cas system-associated protein Csm6